jgi:cob(I)alamin adenosyltransferase
MTKIYTRTGDGGETSLFGAGRVRKDALRVEVIGTIDELNATLGVAAAALAGADRKAVGIAATIRQVQHQLLALGADLADPDAGTCRTRDQHVTELEATIDGYETRLEPLDEFILPGGSPAGAALHLARCVCRRAERRLVSLAAQEAVASQALCYVNRLGDLLFVLARAENRSAGAPEVTWQQDR